MEYMKKLIEVALPLEAINRESAREKSIRHGHPSTLHLWWARRPLAACRAVLFASLVDDPSSHPELFPTEKAQEEERQRLFRIIERLVIWENSHNEQVLTEARAEIMKSTGGNPPAVLDPFCGGGSIPLEAQRLGLKAFGSDLNPVAVLVTKALVEIPPKFSGMPPVNPKVRAELNATIGWKGAKGLAEDVRYYGQWMREEAQKRIGHLYPPVRLPKELGNGQATVIAWLWARTVRCPNPACGCEMPLVRSFWLSKKKGKEAWVEPVVKESRIEYEVRYGKGPVPEGTVNRKGAKCICCGAPASFDYIRTEGRAGRIKAEMLAIVAEGLNGRVYLSVVEEQVKSAHVPKPEYFPDAELPTNPRDFKTPNYGMTRFSDLFTNRQLTALSAFSELVREAREKIKNDALSTGTNLDKAQEYADAVSVYLAFAVDKLADYCSSVCSWHSSGEKMRNTFARQAIPMVWDYAEVNPFSSSSGSITNCLEWCEKYLRYANPKALGFVRQKNAMEGFALDEDVVVSTDPPYYDNIGYADLSDFFYIWLRQSLKQVYPELFSTVLVPKAAELIATPYRFDGDKQKAKEFFEDGLRKAFENIRKNSSDLYPVTVYYAFKQTDSEEVDEESANFNTVMQASTGWETMLSGLISAGFTITGTWPIRTEMMNRSVAMGSNALASSIVLVCRKRPADAPTATRRDFVNSLRRELRNAIHHLQTGNIAPVDLAQASIGPGMAVFSRYAKVLEADGTPMTVRTALQIINQELDAYLTAQEGEMDSDSRFCVAWYEQYGLSEQDYGQADVLSRAKNTSVHRLAEEGVLEAAKGKVRLLKRQELKENWQPTGVNRMIWMYTQQLVKALEQGGESKTAELIYQMSGDSAENAKALAYRLYTIAERKGWTEDALAYNSLVVAWPEIQKKAAELAAHKPEQQSLF